MIHARFQIDKAAEGASSGPHRRPRDLGFDGARRSSDAVRLGKRFKLPTRTHSADRRRKLPFRRGPCSFRPLSFEILKEKTWPLVRGLRPAQDVPKAVDFAASRAPANTRRSPEPGFRGSRGPIPPVRAGTVTSHESGRLWSGHAPRKTEPAVSGSEAPLHFFLVQVVCVHCYPPFPGGPGNSNLRRLREKWRPRVRAPGGKMFVRE